MFRGTTPTYTFSMPDGVDLTLASRVYVTFCKLDGALIIEKSDEDLEITDRTVEVFLTQEETLSFPNGLIQVQLNWLYEEGSRIKRACSQIMQIKAEKNLIDEVISNE